MKNNKLIQTVNILNDVNNPISLKSYQIYHDKSNNRNFLLAKLVNNYLEELNDLGILIIERNDSKQVLQESLFNFDDLDVSSNENFALPSKIKLNDSTVSIEIKVISASFKTNEIIDGELVEHNIISNIDINEKKTKIDRISFNRSLKPLIFATITTILLVALLLVNIFSEQDNYFTNHLDFEYIENHDGTLEITGYNGISYNVIVPATINGKSVTSIGVHAFSNSKIKKINIESSTITIKYGAFKYATKLRTFTANNIDSIESEAFSNARRLRSFTANRINVVKSYAFENTYKLKRILSFEVYDVYFYSNALKGSNLEHYLDKEK